MGWLNLSSLRNLFATRSTSRLLGLTERQFQEWVDLHRLYLALAYYNGKDIQVGEDLTERLSEEAASKSVEVRDKTYASGLFLTIERVRLCAGAQELCDGSSQKTSRRYGS